MTVTCVDEQACRTKVMEEGYMSMVTCSTCLTNILKIFQESDLTICPTLVSGTYAMCVFALLVK